MLNEMRFGVMSSETIAAFTKLSRPIHYTDGIDPCALYPTRGEVTSHNNAELAKLPGGLETYVAHDTCGKDSNGKPTTEARREQILSNLVCEKFLKLKVKVFARRLFDVGLTTSLGRRTGDVSQGMFVRPPLLSSTCLTTPLTSRILSKESSSMVLLAKLFGSPPLQMRRPNSAL